MCGRPVCFSATVSATGVKSCARLFRLVKSICVYSPPLLFLEIVKEWIEIKRDLVSLASVAVLQYL